MAISHFIEQSVAIYIFLVCAVQCRACVSQFPNLQDILCEGAFWFLLLCQANATVAMAMAMFESALSPLSCYFFTRTFELQRPEKQAEGLRRELSPVPCSFIYL